MKCILFGHIWHVTERKLDPMDSPGVYSNYIHHIFECECLVCGNKKVFNKNVQIPEDSQQLENRLSSYFQHRLGR